MVQDMYVQVDGTWLKLFSTPLLTTAQTGLTFDPYYFFYAPNDKEYLCTWVKPKEPPSFPGVLEMIAAERRCMYQKPNRKPTQTRVNGNGSNGYTEYWRPCCSTGR